MATSKGECRTQSQLQRISRQQPRGRGAQLQQRPRQGTRAPPSGLAAENNKETHAELRGGGPEKEEAQTPQGPPRAVAQPTEGERRRATHSWSNNAARQAEWAGPRQHPALQTKHLHRHNTLQTHSPHILHFPVCKETRPLPPGNRAFGTPHHTTPHHTTPHRPQRLSPDAAMMVLMAKLPSKLLSLASVYRPTARVHAANDALMVRAYKHMTSISRHAHTDPLWEPWEHGRQGLTRSEHS